MSDFRLVGSRYILESGYLRVSRSYWVAPDAAAIVRETVHHPGSVVVVPVEDGDVVLLRQYRTAAGRSLYELPAGKRDIPGEEPEAAAARECEEETGLRPRRLTFLHTFFNSPGFLDEYSWLFLAEDLEHVGSDPQGAEERAAEVVRMPLQEAIGMAEEGEIVDAKTLIGLYAAEARLR